MESELNEKVKLLRILHVSHHYPPLLSVHEKLILHTDVIIRKLMDSLKA